MNLADARLSHTESFGDFAEAHIFEIIKRENFALHVRQLLEAIGDHAREFLLRDGVIGRFVRAVRNPFVAGGLVVFVAADK